MKVVATAGHVDHGKSALIRALTGMEPDRWAEERRRGMTIDLGFAWTTLGPETIAFVDVPGHQRFVTNMLAGVGPVPAVLFVVAADAGWSRQSAEHLDALQALGIRHGVLAVTKTDLVPPERASAVAADATARLARAGLAARPVLVSARRGTGLVELRTALTELVGRLPEPSAAGRVRLWIDRVFTVRGAGTVVTGTLGAGRITIGDALAGPGGTVTIRQLQQLGGPVEQATSVSRVAVNLRGVDRDQLRRGDVLTTPGAWWWTDTIDVRLDPLFAEPAAEQTLHLGSASIPVRVRPLGDSAARLSLDRAVPLQYGDRAVLRDPGQQSVTAGVLVLDPEPPALLRRGDAGRRGAELASGAAASTAAQVARRGAVRAEHLQRLGIAVDPAGLVVIGDWLIDPRAWPGWQQSLRAALDRQAARDPRQPWLTTEAARRLLAGTSAGPAAPDRLAPELLAPLVEQAGLELADGRISRPGLSQSLGRATAAFEWLATRWEVDPLYAPERTELAEHGLTGKDLATAERTGRAVRLAPDLVVGPTAIEFSLRGLAELDQPFTVSAARQRLGSTRRVMVPLLERLDRLGHTVPDGAGGRRLA